MCRAIAGYNHVAGGRTFGKATKKALDRDPVQLMVSEQIPSSPTTTSKTRFLGDAELARGHLPGYAGHVPDFKDLYVCVGVGGDLDVSLVCATSSSRRR